MHPSLTHNVGREWATFLNLKTAQWVCNPLKSLYLYSLLVSHRSYWLQSLLSMPISSAGLEWQAYSHPKLVQKKQLILLWHGQTSTEVCTPATPELVYWWHYHDLYCKPSTRAFSSPAAVHIQLWTGCGQHCFLLPEGRTQMEGKQKVTKWTKAEGFGVDSACESGLDHFPKLKDYGLMSVPFGTSTGQDLGEGATRAGSTQGKTRKRLPTRPKEKAMAWSLSSLK